MAGTIGGSYDLQPSSVKATLQSNYITNFDFLNQYLPDTYEQEFARYGDRSVSSFLRRMGAEIPSNSDLIKWTEEGRLHTKYAACSIAYGGGNDTAVLTVNDVDAAGNFLNSVFRIGQTVFLSSNVNSAQSDKAIITAISASSTNVTPATFTVAYYAAAGGTITDSGNNDITAFVYGSEFKKGSNGMSGSLDAAVDIFDVSPIIIKDKFEIAGSDMAQIGWVEVEGDGGMSYLWYLKSKSETRMRFEDYLEMMMVEHVEAASGSGAIAASGDVGNKGTEGMFAAVEARGNTWSGGVPSTLADFDTILNRLDKQGAIAENTLFTNRTFALAIDDMLAAQNSYGVGGTSYGLFDNDEKMALNLGFTGFRRGSYDFYKTDWKYLNDATLRGGITGGVVNGVLVPAGTMNVYDQVVGKRMQRPFLHVRYRQSETENRKYKTWITGSAGGASTSDLDAMQVHFLSERALCTLGANNFFLFQ
jgi:hypothetical protein